MLLLYSNGERFLSQFNPPGIDLSRRIVFAAAHIFLLIGAGMIGFALGTHPRTHHSDHQPQSVLPDLHLRRKVVLWIVVGILLVIAAGAYEYEALTDHIP